MALVFDHIWLQLGISRRFKSFQVNLTMNKKTSKNHPVRIAKADQLGQFQNAIDGGIGEHAQCNCRNVQESQKARGCFSRLLDLISGFKLCSSPDFFSIFMSRFWMIFGGSLTVFISFPQQRWSFDLSFVCFCAIR